MQLVQLKIEWDHWLEWSIFIVAHSFIVMFQVECIVISIKLMTDDASSRHEFRVSTGRRWDLKPVILHVFLRHILLLPIEIRYTCLTEARRLLPPRYASADFIGWEWTCIIINIYFQNSIHWIDWYNDCPKSQNYLLQNFRSSCTSLESKS